MNHKNEATFSNNRIASALELLVAIAIGSALALSGCGGVEVASAQPASPTLSEDGAATMCTATPECAVSGALAPEAWRQDYARGELRTSACEPDAADHRPAQQYSLTIHEERSYRISMAVTGSQDFTPKMVLHSCADDGVNLLDTATCTLVDQLDCDGWWSGTQLDCWVTLPPNEYVLTTTAAQADEGSAFSTCIKTS